MHLSNGNRQDVSTTFVAVEKVTPEKRGNRRQEDQETLPRTAKSDKFRLDLASALP